MNYMLIKILHNLINQTKYYLLTGEADLEEDDEELLL